ncbi:MAG: PTS sugar transporter subunit IIB [bacterium]
MPLVLLRIDDRLIHGQVVEGWLDAVGANLIIIASDEIAEDEFQQTLLTLAVPPRIRAVFLKVNDVIGFFNTKQQAGDRILLLVDNPNAALQLIESGVKISSINVGGMHYGEGKKQILPFLSVDADDRKSFEKINQMNVMLEGRVLPGDTPIDIIDLLHRVF